ncbi:hypothetical protein DEJ23_13215 [Curtobacterium sp. MCSS17_008]|uniref:hypothetical protein n=1 Tax=Curtobacterium sp. MCSS17_008 TaxID=2175647 RepID=UPI000DA8E773|nr:hypothetical protein [Curtobacterium sp. MCSS17_008]PZF54971.1 hypothetical protein DEJ23_13215 [Curtobacterium sp. MCSS17_008]
MARGRRAVGAVELVVMCVVSVALTIGSLLHKLQCAGPGLGLADVTRRACLGDTLSLWGLRDLDSHVFPYVGALRGDPPLPPGTLEYPTLTGLWAWLSALPVGSLPGFLVVTAITFVPVVVVVTVMLAKIAGRRAWIFAATPPLFLYALYNWDLLTVLCTVAALFAAVRWPSGRAPLWRAVVVGALFGLGGAFKLYPVAFVAPFALAFLVDAGLAWSDRVRRAAGAVGGAVAVLLAANLPFALVAPASWFSVIRFQGTRDIDASTLSVWFWGLQPWSATTDPAVQHRLNLLATGATALTVLTVLVVGLVLGVRRGRMPWIETSAALLCAYLVSNKVDSLQYILWLTPFFVVVRVRLGWVIAYTAANLLLFAGWFRSVFLHAVGTTGRTYADEALSIGLWGQIILLPILAFVFLKSRAVDQDEQEPVPDQTARLEAGRASAV